MGICDRSGFTPFMGICISRWADVEANDIEIDAREENEQETGIHIGHKPYTRWTNGHR